METIRDRYTSFANIDCDADAMAVVGAMERLFALHPEAKNAFWQRFGTDTTKDMLYHVCASVFYVFDLFEEYAFEEGIEVMKRVELECC